MAIIGDAYTIKSQHKSLNHLSESGGRGISISAAAENLAIITLAAIHNAFLFFIIAIRRTSRGRRGLARRVRRAAGIVYLFVFRKFYRKQFPFSISPHLG